jgi:hypothetical protein
MSMNDDERTTTRKEEKTRQAKITIFSRTAAEVVANMCL